MLKSGLKIDLKIDLKIEPKIDLKIELKKRREFLEERRVFIGTKDEERREKRQVCVAQLQCGSLWAKRRSGFTHPPPIQYETDFRLIFFEAGRPEFAKNPGKTAKTDLKTELENRPDN